MYKQDSIAAQCLFPQSCRSCAPTLGRSVRHGQIIRSRAARLSSRCLSSYIHGYSSPYKHLPIHASCFMLHASCLLLGCFESNCYNDWHDNSPLNSPSNSPPPLLLSASHSLLLSSSHLLIFPSCPLPLHPSLPPSPSSLDLLPSLALSRCSPRLTGWPFCPSSSPHLL